jgi:hypothetical protein
LVGTKYPDAFEQRGRLSSTSLRAIIIFKKEIAGKPRARVTRWPLAAAFSI